MDRENRRPRAGFGAGIFAGFLAGLLAAALLIGGAARMYTNLTGRYLVIGSQNVGTIAPNAGLLDQSTVDKLEELLAYMDIYYYDDYDSEDVKNAVLKGTLAGLGDPYSVYYTAEEYESLKVDTSGSYYGIGAGLVQDAATMEVTVSKVYEDTPAEEAGLREGDRILMVDDIDAASMELSALVQHIRGEEGTTVHLLVFRESADTSMAFDVERRNVQILSVSGELLDGEIGYIQISEFQAKTGEQFANMVKRLEGEGMRAMIVDLRGNPGGLVSAVVEVLDGILPEGTLVYTEDKFGNRDTFTSDSRCMDYPLVVLVDSGSASASEIFAGAVKDYGCGVLVGTTTFGKGIVQTVFPLGNGAAVKLTTAKYFTPKGNNIHGVGIEPDEVVEYQYEGPKDEPYDMQYDNQLNYARGRIQEMLR